MSLYYKYFLIYRQKRKENRNRQFQAQYILNSCPCYKTWKKTHCVAGSGGATPYNLDLSHIWLRANITLLKLMGRFDLCYGWIFHTIVLPTQIVVYIYDSKHYWNPWYMMMLQILFFLRAKYSEVTFSITLYHQF